MVSSPDRALHHPVFSDRTTSDAFPARNLAVPGHPTLHPGNDAFLAYSSQFNHQHNEHYSAAIHAHRDPFYCARLLVSKLSGPLRKEMWFPRAGRAASNLSKS